MGAGNSLGLWAGASTARPLRNFFGAQGSYPVVATLVQGRVEAGSPRKEMAESPAMYSTLGQLALCQYCDEQPRARGSGRKECPSYGWRNHWL